jgi:hypothetical protein
VPVFQIGRTILNNGVNDRMMLAYNYARVGGVNQYIANDYATYYTQISGQHQWYLAPSGTAGNTITFTQAMTLFNSGGLSLGNTTDPGAKNLSVTGTIASASTVTGTQLISNVATGTAPLSVTSTTVVPNLNVSQLLGATWAAPGTIGSTTPNTGSFTSLTATGAITYNTTTNNQSYTTSGAGTITITSGTAGNINNMNIGATTAGTGAFTTLSASSTVSGTGFSNYLASPPAIGGTSPAAGKFTSITNTGLTSGRVVYSSTGGLETDSASLTFDGSNLSSPAFIATGTGAITVPASITSNRPGTPTTGMFRFNTTLTQFEGFDGSNWGGIGGAQAGGVIQVNKTNATVSYTLPSGSNGFSVGPITVASGVTITVTSGQRWVVI